MNTIFLDENLIQLASTHLSKYTSDLSDAVSRLSRLLGQIDNRVLSRSDVGSRLGNLCKELGIYRKSWGISRGLWRMKVENILILKIIWLKWDCHSAQIP